MSVRGRLVIALARNLSHRDVRVRVRDRVGVRVRVRVRVRVKDLHATSRIKT